MEKIVLGDEGEYALLSQLQGVYIYIFTTHTLTTHTHTHVQWRTKDRGLFNWLNILKQGHQSSKKSS